MGRILAIDYGTKRSGLAATDPLKIIANGLTTVPTGELLDFLKDYIAEEEVEKIVIGEPKMADGGDTKLTPLIKGLIKKLHKLFPTIEVVLFDERYTSKRAEETIRMVVKSKKKRRNKALIDTVSATIILQDYMQEFLW